MATYRIFCYNPSPNPPIPGTEQVGDIAATIGTSTIDPTKEWWNGPDEELGYVIAYVDNTGDRPNGPERVLLTNFICHIGFKRSKFLTEESFLQLVNRFTGTNFTTGDSAKNWLESNGYWTSYGQLPNGMVLFLDAGNLNSYSGTEEIWTDISGYNNNGTLSGATFSTDSGGTMLFDGVNDAITFTSTNEIPIGNEPYTISVWFNSNEMPSDRGFVGWGGFGNVNEVNAWRLRNTGSSGFRHYWWGNDLDYTTPMSSGKWYHAIAAYENGSRKLYLNNVKVAEDFPTGHNVPYSNNLRIGVTADFLGEWFDGKIAQVVIYKRQATEDEIRVIWNSGKNRFGYNTVITENLLVNLDAGNTQSYIGSGSLWEDLTINNNDVTLSGNDLATYNTQYGGYLNFDDDNFEKGVISDLGDLSTWTVEVWFRLTTSLSGKVTSLVTNEFDLVNKLNFSIGTNNSPSNYNLCVGFFDSSGWHNTSGFVPNTNQWYQIIGTYDGATIKQYVDGAALGGTVNYTGSPQSGGEVRIMRRWDDVDTSSSNFVDGDIQVVRIYNRSLDAWEVKHNYEMNKNRFL